MNACSANVSHEQRTRCRARIEFEELCVSRSSGSCLRIAYAAYRTSQSSCLGRSRSRSENRTIGTEIKTRAQSNNRKAAHAPPCCICMSQLREHANSSEQREQSFKFRRVLQSWKREMQWSSQLEGSLAVGAGSAAHRVGGEDGADVLHGDGLRARALHVRADRLRAPTAAMHERCAHRTTSTAPRNQRRSATSSWRTTTAVLSRTAPVSSRT